MDFSVSRVSRAFQVYQSQTRIADLNKQSNLRTVQGQADRVSLSTEALRLFEQNQVRASNPSESTFESRQATQQNTTTAASQAASTTSAQAASTPTAQTASAAGPQAAIPIQPAPTTTRPQTGSTRGVEPAKEKPSDEELLDFLNIANSQEEEEDFNVPFSFRRGSRLG
ncbi:hypothetical protein NITGR_40004 [Nitrospina gracilis 3/211]|uniref:Uncharacterized protein n=1 Tax=Nitrospina gracilis (strain 3/211) TaxID=1266370 RepID=M1ZC19_NITG3|nr:MULTISPECIES: hypothetical protein [Nitrospina]MCF8722413.1 cobalamin biosynthesis Mg chelatase CobN [Nitrospina sp. Nb-3]CCQ90807.1 hypothetical protein NITGR_40004 [Nitrospina gracilis 3/211]